MNKLVRNAVIAVVIVLILVAAYVIYLKKKTVKFTISEIAPASGAKGRVALTVSGAITSSAFPKGFVGKKITLYTKSLGTIKTTIASIGPAAPGAESVTTAPVAFSQDFSYQASPSDYARVYLM